MSNSPRASSIRPIWLLLVFALAGLAALGMGLSSSQASSPAVPDSPASVVTLTADADSTVLLDTPTSNYGTNTTLAVGLDLGVTGRRDLARSLIRFPVPQSQCPVVAARLLVYENSGTGANPLAITVYGVFNLWDEILVNWNNQPGIGSAVTASNLDFATGYKAWNVTSLVQKWSSGDIRNLGLELRSNEDSLGHPHFSSREGKNPPRLEIDYNCPATATSTSTATPTVTRTPTPTATRTPIITPQPFGRLAYVYNGNQTLANDFKTFLYNRGWDVTLVEMANVLSTDFSPFRAILIADDSGSLDVWGSGNEAAYIARYEKPVLGLGEGGYAFFGKRKLFIGWGNGNHGSSSSLWAADTSLPYYHTPNPIFFFWTPLAQLYNVDVNTVSIYTGNGVPGNVLLIGHFVPLNVGPDYPFIGQGCSNILWGWSGGPVQMTAKGKDIFQNTVFNLADTTGCHLPTPTPTAPPVTLDLVATGLEVNQAIQNLSNSVPLVDGKRAVVRFYVRSNGPNVANVAATLHGCGPSIPGGCATLNPSNPGGVITVKPSPDRAQLNDAFYFDLPASWRHGTLQLDAHVNQAHNPAEINYSNNSSLATVNFHVVPPMSMRLHDIQYKIGSTYYDVSNTDEGHLEDWLRRAYPIGELTYRWIVYWGDWQPGLPNVDDVNNVLDNYRSQDLGNGVELNKTRYYGMVEDTSAGGGYGPTFMRGKAKDIPGHVAAGPAVSGSWGWDFDGSYGDWYGGHEIGHTFGRYHPGFCRGESHDDGSYPYPNGQIGNNSNDFYGLDVSTHQIYPPTQWFDVMTYCNNQWISAYTYQGIMNQMISEGSTLEAASVQVGSFIRLAGKIGLNDDALTLYAWYHMQQAQPTQPKGESYHYRFTDANGQVLADIPFTPQADIDSPFTNDPNATPEPPVVSFSDILAFPDGTQRISIWHGDKELGGRNVSQNIPQVSVVFPNGGETLTGDTAVVRWNASGGNGDPLNFVIQYSRDNGKTWRTLVSDVTGTSAPINLRLLAGSQQAHIRVIASDGIDQSQADSAGPFSVPNHPPVVRILTPGNNAHILPGQPVILEGTAFSPQDGALDGVTEPQPFHWLLDGNALGDGRELSEDSLPTGDHTLTLVATDSTHTSGQASITIHVDDFQGSAIYLPVLVK